MLGHGAVWFRFEFENSIKRKDGNSIYFDLNSYTILEYQVSGHWVWLDSYVYQTLIIIYRMKHNEIVNLVRDNIKGLQEYDSSGQVIVNIRVEGVNRSKKDIGWTV